MRYDWDAFFYRHQSLIAVSLVFLIIFSVFLVAVAFAWLVSKTSTLMALLIVGVLWFGIVEYTYHLKKQ